MKTIDIREAPEAISEIRFASKNTAWANADTLSKQDGGPGVRINDSTNSEFLRIHSKEQAENLIKALGKAIELDWFK